MRHNSISFEIFGFDFSMDYKLIEEGRDDKITIQSIRLDSYIIENPDLIEKYSINNLIYEDKIQLEFNKFTSGLFDILLFRNTLIEYFDNEKDYIYKENMSMLEYQLRLILLRGLLDVVKDDIYYKFGHKELYCEMLYKKYRLTDIYYYGNLNKKNIDKKIISKEVYIASYLEFLDFAMENDQIYGIEKKVRSIFIGEKDELKRGFIDKKRVHIIKEYIDDWFLKKSDYKSVDILLKGLKTIAAENTQNKESTFPKGLRKYDFIHKITNCFKIFFSYASNFYSYLLSSSMINLLVLIFPIINFLIFRDLWKGSFYKVQNILLLVIVFYYINALIFNFKRFASLTTNILYIFNRRYYPRLLGAIIVGYTLLLLGDEVYKYIMNLDGIRILLITIISIILTYVYLYSEISNKSQLDIWKRAWKVCFTGLCHSYLLIYILNIFVCTGFLKGLVINDELNQSENLLNIYNQYKGFVIVDINNPYLLNSIFHYKITIIYPVLAFMIGVFIQILWDEAEITKPLQ